MDGRGVGRRSSACAAIVLLLLFVAGFTIRIGREPRRIYLVDVSSSLKGAAQETLARVRKAVRATRGGRVALAVFASEPCIVSDFDSPEAIWLPESLSSSDGTDIEAALRFAGRKADEVVLITDGNETTGDAAQAAAELAVERVRLFVVPVQWRPLDFAIAHIEAPASVRAGESFELVVEVTGTAPGSPVVAIERDGTPIQRAPIPVADGRTSCFRMTEVPTRPGLCRYSARILSPDEIPANNAARTAVKVGGGLRVLWLGNQLESPGLVPESGADGLTGCDALVVWDWPLWKVPSDVCSRIAEFVKNGGGLVMIGVRGAFGAGGYSRSPFEDVLPVEWGSRRNNLALALVLDRSGSMDMPYRGKRKIDYAKEAAAQLLGRLREEDQFSLAVFSGQAEVVFPLQRGLRLQELLQRLAPVEAGGPTELGKGLALALDELAASSGRRHVIVVSDGRSRKFDETPLVEKAQRMEVSVSTVGTGEDVDEALLERIAVSTKGRYYRVTSIAALGDVLLKDATEAAGSFYDDRPRRFDSVKGELTVPGGTADRIALVKLKSVGRAAALSEKGEPIVAYGRFGSGRSVAIATDGQGWAGFDAAVLSAVRWVGRKEEEGCRLWTGWEDGEVRIVVRVTRRGHEADGLSLDALIAGEGSRVRLSLAQTFAGTYSLRTRLERSGRYDVTIFEAGRAIASGVVEVPYASEWRRFGLDRSKLREIAEAGGGTLVPNLDALPARVEGGRSGAKANWLLLAGALILYSIALALRD